MRLSQGLLKLLLPVIDRLSASTDVADPWERVDASLEAADFGSGSQHPFPWYFEGVSSVTVQSPREVADWLCECEYVPDAELFRDTDYWQHPLTFEQLRRGDCEDHALWGWRKLSELGYDATLVVGTFRRETYVERGHAWVVFAEGEQRFLLDGISHDRERVLRPFDVARGEYVPHAAVDARFRTWGYMGARLTGALRHRDRQGRRNGDGAA